MIPQLGPLEIVVVVLVALLVFGPHRMPEVGRQVGRGLRQIRRLQDQVREELDAVLHADDPVPSAHADDAVPPQAAEPSTARPAAGDPDTAPMAPSRFRPPGPPDPTAGAGVTRGGTGRVEIGRAPSRFRPPAGS